MEARERQAALARARQGDNKALGELLQSFRPYVQAIVRGFRDQRLQGRLDDSARGGAHRRGDGAGAD